MKAALYCVQSVITLGVPVATRLLWRHAAGGVSTWSRELQQIEYSSLCLYSLVPAILHLQH